MKTTMILRTMIYAVVSLALTAYVPVNATNSEYGCTIPCLADTPMLSSTVASSASGDTVTLSFTIQGDVTNVRNVSVILKNTGSFSGNTNIAGRSTLFSPTQAEITMDIVINSDTSPGTYYPLISITPNAPTYSDNHYSLDVTKSIYSYTYAEVIEGASSIPTVTDLAIPTIQVQ